MFCILLQVANCELKHSRGVWKSTQVPAFDSFLSSYTHMSYWIQKKYVYSDLLLSVTGV